MLINRWIDRRNRLWGYVGSNGAPHRRCYNYPSGDNSVRIICHFWCSVCLPHVICGRPAATIGLASFQIGPKDHFFDILKPQTHVSLVKCTQP